MIYDYDAIGLLSTFRWRNVGMFIFAFSQLLFAFLSCGHFVRSPYTIK